jgi:hypothetical protein
MRRRAAFSSRNASGSSMTTANAMLQLTLDVRTALTAVRA